MWGGGWPSAEAAATPQSTGGAWAPLPGAPAGWGFGNLRRGTGPGLKIIPLTGVVIFNPDQLWGRLDCGA